MPEEIIALYCACDEVCKLLLIRDDRQAQMTTAEVMTTALVAARLFGGNAEQARAFLKAYGYIPKMLGSSRLNRRLHQVPEAAWQTLLYWAGQAHALAEGTGEYLVDSMPVTACALARRKHSRLYPGQEWLGYCSSKDEFFHGLRAQVLTTAGGWPVELVLVPGSRADVRSVKQLEFGLPAGAVVYADKGYNDYDFDLLLEDSMELHFSPLRRKNSVLRPPGWLIYTIRSLRKRIEVTFARITQLMPRRIHAVTPRGFELKTALFVLAVALCG